MPTAPSSTGPAIAILDALTEAGGLDSLFIETKHVGRPTPSNGGKTLTITTVNGKQKPVEGRLFSVAWNDENALVLMINTQVVSDERRKATETSLRRVENENHELRVDPRHRHRRRAGARPRRPRAVGQPQRRGAVRLRRRRLHRAHLRRPVRAGKPAHACSIISNGWRAARRRHARRRPRGDRPRAPGRPGAALHHHRAASRTARSSARCCATSPPGSAPRKN